ncbi:hypothetical protein F1880_000466 [Penicillium rolfsii]|nr:hypothetical protein F1880_000466 [Penicillium rolfsii]
MVVLPVAQERGWAGTRSGQEQLQEAQEHLKAKGAETRPYAEYLSSPASVSARAGATRGDLIVPISLGAPREENKVEESQDTLEWSEIDSMLP